MARQVPSQPAGSLALRRRLPRFFGHLYLPSWPGLSRPSTFWRRGYGRRGCPSLRLAEAASAAQAGQAPGMTGLGQPRTSLPRVSHMTREGACAHASSFETPLTRLPRMRLLGISVRRNCCRALRPHPEEPASSGRLEGWRSEKLSSRACFTPAMSRLPLDVLVGGNVPLSARFANCGASHSTQRSHRRASRRHHASPVQPQPDRPQARRHL
ncbi:hypothetical protein ABIA03_004155 [Bradyrhizobium yuanmingense]|uniref:Uncharacterized protein n=1 Tax=Bradyrhizobium yuanmingense TaxID=108015 RepID=A0ABV4GDF1_9BRAD